MQEVDTLERTEVLQQDNPFQNLRPVMRSEEDDIRKGVFSRALRNLAQCTLEEKRRWCHAIRESTAPRRGSRHAAELHTRNDANALCSGAPHKKRRTSASGDVLGAHAGDDDDMDARSKCNSPPTVPGEGTNGATAKPTLAGLTLQDDVCSSSTTTTTHTTPRATPESAFTAAEAGEYIAAFMRALLDRVVGGSLNNLSAPALRVLCYMLHIETSARSKEVLYNILANFYYTRCERLGKRVSRSTFVASRASHEAQMMKDLAAKGGTGGRRRHAATSPDSAEMPADGPFAPAAHTALSKQRTTQKHKSVTPAVMPSTSPPHVAKSHPREETEVVLAPRVFARPDADKQPAVNVKPTMDDPAAWTASELERKVASIVQLYDPVTVAIVTKKLAQMGYTESNAYNTVEAILKRFHQRQLIFYDSGIAYLM